MEKPSNELYSMLLDPNHSHFIIIDDDAKGEFGKDMLFRTRLESELRKYNSYTAAQWQELRRKKNDSSVQSTDRTSIPKHDHTNFSIPMILICVNGGYDALKHINACLKMRTPILLLQVFQKIFQFYP
jgi:hypothetical protein